MTADATAPWALDESASPTMDQLALPTALTILPTYRCSAACANCCFGSNPQIEHRVPQENLLDYIDQAAATLPSIRIVVFSGGEPFLLGDDLVELVARCHHHGFATRIVSNGYWATSPRVARRRLEALRGAGLFELNISTGDEHGAYVRYDCVVNALEASLLLGMTAVLVVETSARSRLTRARFDSEPRLRRAARSFQGRDRLLIIETTWMENFDGPVPARMDFLLNRGTLTHRQGCDSIMRTIVVTPNEQLGMCCGLTREQIPELNEGDLRETPMAQLFEQGTTDLIKIRLALEGPEKMLAEAADTLEDVEWENRYAHHCDACRALYDDERIHEAVVAQTLAKKNDLLLRFAITRNATQLLRPDQEAKPDVPESPTR